MKKNNFSRRDFLRKSLITTGGVATFSSYAGAKEEKNNLDNSNGSPREVWIASISQQDVRARTSLEMVDKIFNILNDNVNNYQPDIICLPEFFPFSGIEIRNNSWEEKLRTSSEVLVQFSNYAKQNKCYIICPVYTTESGKIFNAAVVFDREGNRLGEYRKIHITEDEVTDGITPGPIDPPIFQTDFGKIGIQICYDIMWEDSWKKLREKSAEIILFPSAFACGQMFNAKAWQNMCVVVSSTSKDTSKICDVTGKVISQTGRFNRNLICAPVNLEKAFLHLWPSYQRFGEIKEKYGRKIQITIYHEEEWAIIESLSSDVLIADVLNEFNLRSKKQLLHDSEMLQNKLRGKVTE